MTSKITPPEINLENNFFGSSDYYDLEGECLSGWNLISGGCQNFKSQECLMSVRTNLANISVREKIDCYYVIILHRQDNLLVLYFILRKLISIVSFSPFNMHKISMQHPIITLELNFKLREKKIVMEQSTRDRCISKYLETLSSLINEETQVFVVRTDELTTNCYLI